MNLHWKRALVFYAEDPEWKSKLFFGGLLILVFPPLGWPIALGFRKETAARLADGASPVLPSWRRDLWAFLAEGLKASGVILAYYVPFFAAFWILALPSAQTASEHPAEIGAFFLLLPILVPICVLLLPPVYWYAFSWVELTTPETIVLGVIFWGTAFVLPAAFVQVSLSGRFRHALRAARVGRFIVRHPALYLEAWLISLFATALAAALLPLAPWGFFWSYLVILFAFNDALVATADPEVVTRFQGSRLLNPGANADVA